MAILESDADRVNAFGAGLALDHERDRGGDPTLAVDAALGSQRVVACAIGFADGYTVCLWLDRNSERAGPCPLGMGDQWRCVGGQCGISGAAGAVVWVQRRAVDRGRALWNRVDRTASN